MRIKKVVPIMFSIIVLSVFLMSANAAFAAVVSGAVHNSDGEPIAGARVAAFSPCGYHLIDFAITGNDGLFIMDLGSGVYKFRADAEGFLNQWFDHKISYNDADPVQIHHQGETILHFDLTPGNPPETGALAGTVRGIAPPDPEQFPLGGAEVALFLPNEDHPFRVTISGDDGAYLFQDLPAGDYLVMARADRFYPQWFPSSPNREGAQPVGVPPNGVADGIDFLLEHMEMPDYGIIAGVVRADMGDNPPLPGSVVSLFNEFDPEPIMVVETNDEGSYLFDNIPPGVYFVEANHEGFHPQWFDHKPTRDEADPIAIQPGDVIEGINFTLPPFEGAATVSGVVRGEQGNPLSGALVLAFHPDMDDPVAETVAGDNGGYIFEFLEPGDYQFMAAADGFRPQWFNHQPEREQADIVGVPPDSHIEGIDFDLIPEGEHHTGFIGMVVADGPEHHPIANTLVFAFHPDEQHPVGRAVTNEHGEYFMDVPPGEYIAMAKARHFMRQWYDHKPNREEADIFAVTDGEPTDHIDFSLMPHQQPGGAIFGGTINGDNGEPLPDVRITARMVDPHHHFMRQTFSNLEGNYRINGLMPGRYVIIGEKPNFYGCIFPDTIEVADNEVGPIDLILTPIISGYLSGHIYNSADGSPIWHGRVIAINTENPQINRITETHRDGYYIFDSLPEGYYRVKAEAEGFLPAFYPDSVGVFEDNPAEGIDISLDPLELGNISGVVVDADNGEPIADAIVCARHIGRPWATHTRSADDGSYTLEGLIPGNYHLTSTAIGYYAQPYGEQVFVENGGSVDGIDFQLVRRQEGDGHISGTVVDEQNGMPLFARVVAYGSINEDEPPTIRVFTYTNDDGFYSFDFLPSDFTYRVFANARYHQGEFYENADNWHDATPIYCNADNIDFALTGWGDGFLGIGGEVVNGSGVVPGAIVKAVDDEGNQFITSADIDGSFEFYDMLPGTYQLSAEDFNDGGQYPEPVEITFNDAYDLDISLEATGAEDNTTEIPATTQLLGNYPNPFNPQTAISFSLASNDKVKITIYNIAGQLIKNLADKEYSAGIHNIIWDGSDENGNPAAAGIYFYRLDVGGKTNIGKMTLIK